jgi:ketol-acid reductoisomerase
MSELIRAAFDTLVEAGYSEEVAYFCCLHEVKLIADLVHVRGLAGMRESISEVADLGALRQGPKIIGSASRQAMRQALDEIRSGQFDRELQAEWRAGFPALRQGHEAARAHPLETVGEKLRARMPWLTEGDDES